MGGVRQKCYICLAPTEDGKTARRLWGCDEDAIIQRDPTLSVRLTCSICSGAGCYFCGNEKIELCYIKCPNTLLKDRMDIAEVLRVYRWAFREGGGFLPTKETWLDLPSQLVSALEVLHSEISWLTDQKIKETQQSHGE